MAGEGTSKTQQLHKALLKAGFSPQHVRTTRPLSSEIRGERLARWSDFLPDVMPQTRFEKHAPGYPVGWMHNADLSVTA